MPFNTAQHSIPARELANAGLPTAFYQENFPSELAVVDCLIGTTSLITASLMYLYAGDQITSIGVCTILSGWGPFAVVMLIRGTPGGMQLFRGSSR